MRATEDITQFLVAGLGCLPRQPYPLLSISSWIHPVVIGVLAWVITWNAAALAQPLDDFGPPPQGDPSALTFPLVGEEFAVDALRGLPSIIEGSLEGGPTGTYVDAGLNNAVSEKDETSNKVPSGGTPSPLFGAQSFTQQMLLFEEFGLEPLDMGAPARAAEPFPQPRGALSGPDEGALESFLAQPGLSPLPTRDANDSNENPWRSEIQKFLRRELHTPPAEGRPPGKGWSHQRWNEFFPQAYFKSAQAGARVNQGLRDARQMHGYSRGEFGPGGLYHKVYSSSVPGAPKVEGTTEGLAIRFHPSMPVQDPKTLWTFDGTLPPKLLMARHGEAILFRHYNALPIDPAANRGFGLHTITTHEHNGHTPAESDGYTAAFFFPGQYFDYRWTLALAGYDSINTDASDLRAGFPCAPGEKLYVNDRTPGLKTCPEDGPEKGIIKIRGDWRESESTHWFHDHMLDFTSQNVYKGNAAMMNYYSALDRGYEGPGYEANLRLPSGTALPWGNRDYDVNLVIADKAWDREGQLWFNIFNRDGFLGDQLMANWLYHPYLDVRARRYRFRILNGSVARYLKLALVRQVHGSEGELSGPPGSGVSYSRVPFHMVANDGNIMEHAVPFDGGIDLDRDGDLQEHKGVLPTQSIAERYDIVVDFKGHGILPGDRLYLVNLLEHEDGRRPNRTIPLADVLSERYQARARDEDGDGVLDRWRDGDPAVGRFLELRVHAYAGEDPSMNPADYIPGRKKMIPLAFNREDPADIARLRTARHRSFEFVRSSGTDESPWTIKTDGGGGLAADPRRISAAPQLATGPTMAGYAGEPDFEVWSIHGNGGWSHPVHVHFEEGVILTRDGQPPPEWEKWARKDMYRIGPEEDSSRVVEIAIQFREFAGTYVEHCHNTTHEDHAMLLRWDLEHPGQVELMPTPLPTWDGVEYVDSAALPTFRDGDGVGPEFALGPTRPAPGPGDPAPDPGPPPGPGDPSTPPPAPDPGVPPSDPGPPARTPTRLELRLADMIQKTQARMTQELARPAPRQRVVQTIQKRIDRLRARLVAAQEAAQRPRRQINGAVSSPPRT